MSVLFTSTFVLADDKVYRWKDSNGNWVFSDVPKSGSKEVKLNKPMIIPAENTAVLNNKKKRRKGSDKNRNNFTNK